MHAMKYKELDNVLLWWFNQTHWTVTDFQYVTDANIICAATWQRDEEESEEKGNNDHISHSMALWCVCTLLEYYTGLGV
jgi:hypothetical protein